MAKPPKNVMTEIRGRRAKTGPTKCITTFRVFFSRQGISSRGILTSRF